MKMKSFEWFCSHVTCQCRVVVNSWKVLKFWICNKNFVTVERICMLDWKYIFNFKKAGWKSWRSCECGIRVPNLQLIDFVITEPHLTQLSNFFERFSWHIAKKPGDLWILVDAVKNFVLDLRAAPIAAKQGPLRMSVLGSEERNSPSDNQWQSVLKVVICLC